LALPFKAKNLWVSELNHIYTHLIALK
jgi:hypothetical protein